MLPVRIAGHDLNQFHAKMQSYPEISSAEVISGAFQGVDRSSLQMLHNRRGGKTLRCRIDFFGKDNYERTMHQSEFEALFLGNEPVQIDIGDGFWYRAVLIKIGEPETQYELITTVEYEFQVTRHRGMEITASVIANDAVILCQSNVKKTDCVIRVLYEKMGSAKNVEVSLNGLKWFYAPSVKGDIVIDGVNKIFSVGSKNVGSLMSWTDFPFLVPGENVLRLSVEGVVVGKKAALISYTPTFL